MLRLHLYVHKSNHLGMVFLIDHTESQTRIISYCKYMGQLLSVSHLTQSHPFIGYRSVIIIHPQNKDSLYTSRPYFSSPVQKNIAQPEQRQPQRGQPPCIYQFLIYIYVCKHVISYIQKVILFMKGKQNKTKKKAFFIKTCPSFSKRKKADKKVYRKEDPRPKQVTKHRAH